MTLNSAAGRSITRILQQAFLLVLGLKKASIGSLNSYSTGAVGMKVAVSTVHLSLCAGTLAVCKQLSDMSCSWYAPLHCCGTCYVFCNCSDVLHIQVLPTALDMLPVDDKFVMMAQNLVHSQ